MSVEYAGQLYLDGLEGPAEQHVVGRNQSTHWVVVGSDSVDLLQGLDVPHLRKMHSSTCNHFTFSSKKTGSRDERVTYNNGAVSRAAVQPVSVETKTK